jgi:hypothetical protein
MFGSLSAQGKPGAPSALCSYRGVLCWKVQPVDISMHLETSGPFAGLWVRTVAALRKAGYKCRAGAGGH